uniref:Uncharacterized protein n=1 Tax=viral metagenome TaxID=1070528 RepID=A0A6M3KTY1_9ZZZZ
MSKRWPKLWGATTAPIEPDDFHPHQAEDISGGTFSDVVKFGDVRSYNWDGGSDLSGGADATATLGYLLDASSGAIQAQVLYVEGGTIGGWTIGASTLVGGDVALDAAGKITAGTGTDIAVLSGANPTYRMWIGAVLGADSPFRVTKAGALSASGATISGAITATSGSLGSLSVTGTLTLAGSGLLQTDSTGARVVLSTADKDKVLLYSGAAGETPGYVYAAGSAPPTIAIRTPVVSGYTKYAQIDLSSDTVGTYGDISLYADTVTLTGVLLAGSALLLRGGVGTGNVSLLGALTKLTMTGNQTIPDATITTVSFNYEYRDTENWHLNATNPSRITFDGPDGTTVQIKGIATFANNATGRRHILVAKNGTVIAQTNANAVSDAASRLNIAIDDYLDNGDYIEMQVYQNSGGDLALTAGVANTHFSLTVQ